MKNLLTLTLIFVCVLAKSQSKTPYVPYYNLGEPWQFQQLSFYGDDEEKTQDSLIELHQIKTKKAYSKNKKGQNVLVSKTIYNGKESQFKIYGMNDRKTNFKSYNKINNYRIYQWKTWGRPQKQINEYKTINGKEFVTERITLRVNKIKGKSQYFWSNQGLLDSMHYFSKRNTSPSSTVHYFYKNEKLAETKTYVKGKLTTVRKYDCTPLGEVQKKVRQTSVCVNTEFDANGNKITVSEYTDEKGRTRKWKTTYVGKSDVVFKKEGFDYKNRRTYLDEITAEKQTYIHYRTRGFRKGKESYKQVKYYDINKNIVKKENYNNGKLFDYITFKYNTNGQLTARKSFNKKGKEYSSLTFEYNNLGLKIKQSKQYKKKLYVITYEYE